MFRAVAAGAQVLDPRARQNGNVKNGEDRSIVLESAAFRRSPNRSKVFRLCHVRRARRCDATEDNVPTRTRSGKYQERRYLGAAFGVQLSEHARQESIAFPLG